MAEMMHAGSITKLDSFNFKSWKFEIEMVLRAQGLWEIANGTEGPPTALKEGDTDVKVKYQLRESKAYSVIALSISQDLRSIIEGVSSAKDLWTTLRETFEPKSRSRIAVLRKEFYSVTYKSGESMHAFIGRVCHLKKQLEDAGKTVEDDELCYQLIGSLPDTYEGPVLQLYQAEDADFTPEKVKKKIVAEYGRQMQRLQSEEDLMHKDALFVQKSEKEWRGKKSKGKTDKARFQGKCFKCQKLGHRAVDCHSKAPEKEEKHSDQKSKAQSRSSAFFASALISSTQSTDTDKWSIDTAATHNFCNRKDWFSSFEELEDCEVACGEGESKAVGKGNIWIEVEDDKLGYIHKFCLKNVIHTPQMRRNLISGRLLDKAGFKAVIGESKIQAFFPDKVLAFEARLESNLYVLSAKVLKGEKTFGKQKDEGLRNQVEASISTLSKDFELWHYRLGHINEADMQLMARNEMVQGIGTLKGKLGVCVPCKLAKSSSSSHKAMESIRSKQPLELVHSDVWGPAPINSLGGARYFVTFTDDFSRKVALVPIATKDKVFQCFLDYKAKAERETGHQLKALRTDNGLEFCARKLTDYCRKEGITHERTNTYSPAMNGVAERINRTLMNTVRAFLVDSNLPPNLWAELVNTAAYLKNRQKHSKIKEKVPLEMWIGRKPSVRHLKRIASTAFVHIPKIKRNKLQRRAKIGVCVGYARYTRGYRIWFPGDNSVEESKYVTFDEAKLGITNFPTPDQTSQIPIFWPDQTDEDEATDTVIPIQNQDIPEIIIPVERTKTLKGWQRQVIRRKSGASAGTVDIYYIAPDGNRMRSPKEVERYAKLKKEAFDMAMFDFSRKNLTTISLPTENESEDQESSEEDLIEANLTEIRIPKNYQQAITSPECEKWMDAMKEEIDTFTERKVMEITPTPDKSNVIGSRWVYTVKKDSTGKIARFKARLVAQGFKQREGIDYEETFSPVVNFSLIRLFMIVFVVMCGWVHHHLDVRCAYLYGPLDKEIFMTQPPGFEEHDPGKFCYRLKKAVYGLHQSGRQWYTELDSTFHKLGFRSLLGTNCVYYTANAIILVYVDDLAVITKKRDNPRGNLQ